jgi:hypothetical protein
MLQVTNCPPRRLGGQKYLDGSYRCKNVTGAHCHSRRFVGWMDSVGRIVEWSVCLWTDRLGTTAHCTVQTSQMDRVVQGPDKFLRLISHGLSNKVYNLNILNVTKFICNKVYTEQS